MPPGIHTAEEDRAWFAARLRDGDHEVWVAEDADGLLLGYALLTATWLDHLFVEPGAPGRGRRRRAAGRGQGAATRRLLPVGLRVQRRPPARFYARRGLVELERTDGSGNEEQAPDVRMAWPGRDPVAFFRGLIDEVDDSLADLLARRAALTRAVQDVKGTRERDPERERRDRRADGAAPPPSSAAERLARIVHAIITESLDAVDQRLTARNPRLSARGATIASAVA